MLTCNRGPLTIEARAAVIIPQGGKEQWTGWGKEKVRKWWWRKHNAADLRNVGDSGFEALREEEWAVSKRDNQAFHGRFVCKKRFRKRQGRKTLEWEKKESSKSFYSKIWHGMMCCMVHVCKVLLKLIFHPDQTTNSIKFQMII